MNNTITSNMTSTFDKRRLPRQGVIQPSYGKYGGYYGIVTGLENKFFSTKRKAKEWFDDLNITPVYC